MSYSSSRLTPLLGLAVNLPWKHCSHHQCYLIRCEFLYRSRTSGVCMFWSTQVCLYIIPSTMIISCALRDLREASIASHQSEKVIRPSPDMKFAILQREKLFTNGELRDS